MALLFARDATRSTPEVAAGVVAETCERFLTQWEPGLVPTWGLDAKHPPAVDSHDNTEECIRCGGVGCKGHGEYKFVDIMQ